MPCPGERGDILAMLLLGLPGRRGVAPLPIGVLGLAGTIAGERGRGAGLPGLRGGVAGLTVGDRLDILVLGCDEGGSGIWRHQNARYAVVFIGFWWILPKHAFGSSASVLYLSAYCIISKSFNARPRAHAGLAAGGDDVNATHHQ